MQAFAGMRYLSEFSVVRICNLLLGLLLVAGFLTFGTEARTEKVEAGSGPDIKVEVTGSQFRVNDQITIRIVKHRISPNSSVGIFLVPVMPENNPPIHGVWNPGCDGPLSSKTVSLNSTGVQEVEWSGRATWWAPVDSPMLCEDVLPGKYQFRVDLFRTQDVPLVGREQGVLPVRSAYSAPFRLRGEMDLSRIERDLNMRAVDFIQKKLEEPNASDFVQEMFRSKGKLQHRSGGYFCQYKVVPLPHEGLVRACTTVPVVTELGLRIPHGEYVETRPIIRISRRAGTLRAVLFKARSAAAFPLLTRLDLSLANEVDKGEGCSISTNDPQCRERVIFTKDASELLATVENLFYRPETDNWAFLFKFEAKKNDVSLFEVDSFVCVSGSGQVMQVLSTEHNPNKGRRKSDNVGSNGLDCEGS